jgi:release factor glutamine methyltransferase
MPESARSSRVTAGSLRWEAARRLNGLSETPALDADLLLGHVLGLNRAALVSEPSRTIGADDRRRFDDLLARRTAGQPIAYLLRSRSFRAIDLYVDERVLVPRPETERLVELASAWVSANRGSLTSVVDVGTGSGAIALALASELDPDLRETVHILGVDVSPAALEVATLNRSQLGLDTRVELRRSDLLGDVSGAFDLILANLPYLRPEQAHPSTAFEPPLALYSGADGFDLYRRFLPQALDRLNPNGMIAVEIDPAQGQTGLALIRRLTKQAAHVVQDFAGRDRYLVIGEIR